MEQHIERIDFRKNKQYTWVRVPTEYIEFLGGKEGPQLLKMNVVNGAIEMRTYDALADKKRSWVKRIMREFRDEGAAAEAHCIGKATFVLVRDFFGERVGMSLCMPQDEYDYETGVAVAYAKAQGYSIPDFI